MKAFQSLSKKTKEILKKAKQMEKEQSFDLKKLERDNKEFLKRKEKLNNMLAEKVRTNKEEMQALEQENKTIRKLLRKKKR